MRKNKRQYWTGAEQLTNHPEYVKYAGKEFPEELPIGRDKDEGGLSGSRRDFLKMMGFSLAAASLAACEAPVRKAIPYLNKPVDIDPGIPNYYASTYAQAGDYCSIVVKTREGRPIKIIGNKMSSISGGKTFPRIEASVLSLYDKERLTDPMKDGKKSEWEIIDSEISAGLTEISNGGGQIRIVSNTILSPTTQQVINVFISKYPGSQHITYDTSSFYGMKEANRINFGQAIIPSYDFSKASVIVNFGADFLGTWLSPITFSRDYAKNRKIDRDHRQMSRHYQYESLLSPTGANADYRIQIKPSSEALIIAKLYNLIAKKSGKTSVDAAEPGEVRFLEKASEKLWENRGSSLVLSGSNDPDIQMLVNGINEMLGNYGKTIDLTTPVNYRKGDERAMDQFVTDLQKGKIEAVILYDVNPVYNHPLGDVLADVLKNVNLTVSTSDRMDETNQHMKYIAPNHHYLESWNDAEPVPGQLSLAQPAITPLFNTRHAQESFLHWAGSESPDYYEYLRDAWKNKYFPTQQKIMDFDRFWEQSLFDGVFSYAVEPLEPGPITFDPASVGNAVKQKYATEGMPFELILYQKVAITDGTHANIPWLQEMPDPISKATWDNYITISQKDARELGMYTDGNHFMTASLQVGEKKVTAPVLIQPGQAKGTLGLAVGYGRSRAGRVANGVGVNAFPFMTNAQGFWSNYNLAGATLSILHDRYQIGQTQTHHTYMDRTNVIQEAYLTEFQADPRAGREFPKIHTSREFDKKFGGDEIDGKVEPLNITLWKGHDYPDHHWGMIVDLNSCIGCGTCTIACQVENNVPVVGKQEVLNRREMHWIRIDRYYSSDAPVNDYRGLEIASDNPEITFQPMMCQHCNNAPCETVCPVAATTHSTEGLNQMIYNRCIGTRYCANNCPYKVRRFNWFKYFDNSWFDMNLAMSNDLGKMVLNPDVMVRSRGVMEKCSFCVQRIQYGKLEAKKENRRPKDGEIVTACAEACPTEALVFGDLNDPDSRIVRMLRITDENGTKKVHQERAYPVLEETGTRPNVFYYTKIRNKDLEDKKA